MVLALAAPAAAQQAQRPEALNRLIECRNLTDAAARLACFDTAVTAFDAAERGGDVVVVDREQVRQSQRQLFGLNVGGLLPIFGRGGDAEPALDAIEGVLATAQQGGGNNRWTFSLEDGSVWRQVDSEPVRIRPRAGHAVRIRRAAMGSFLMSIAETRSVRVERVR